MRYKEYNVNRVLEKTIALIWDKGFNGCSINEIVEATGVNRYSLYHEFENKEGILHASLKLYRDRYCTDKLAILSSDGDMYDALKSFYLSFLEDNTLVPGCYFIHAGTELADSIPKVKQALDEYLTDIKTLIADLLIKNGIEHKEASFKAKHLTGLYCTAMSFCLIHTQKERSKYITNGIQLILPSHA